VFFEIENSRCFRKCSKRSIWIWYFWWQLWKK